MSFFSYAICGGASLGEGSAGVAVVGAFVFAYGLAVRAIWRSPSRVGLAASFVLAALAGATALLSYPDAGNDHLGLRTGLGLAAALLTALLMSAITRTRVISALGAAGAGVVLFPAGALVGFLAALLATSLCLD